jgi:5,10-methylenetetrahydromethanopterin reductase
MKMTFGVVLYCNQPPDVLVERVRLVEDLGFRYFWLSDLALQEHDTFAYLALAALNSSRLGLGPCILHPYTRHFAVALNGMVTIDEISHGRAVFGVGIGGGIVGELGFKPATVAVMRELMLLSRRLMHGEKVDSETVPLQMKAAYLRFPPKRSLPIYVAATGPKMLELTGELADGVFVHVGVARSTLQSALDACRAGMVRRPSQLPPLDFTPFVYTSVAKDRSEAFADCRRGAGVVVKRFPQYAELVGCQPEELAALRRGGSDAEAVLTDRLVDQFSLSGRLDDCLRKIQQMGELGITHVTLIPATKNPVSVIETFGREVLPRFA